MADILDKFTDLKKRWGDEQKAKSRLEGQRDENLRQIQAEFGLKSLAEAEAELARLEGEQKQLEGQAEDELRKIEEQWGAKI